MASVTFVEGWGLNGLFAAQSGPDPEPTTGALGWLMGVTSGTASAASLAVVEDGTGHRNLELTGTANSTANGLTYYRQGEGIPSFLVLGFAITDTWASSSATVAHSPCVGLAFSAGLFASQEGTAFAEQCVCVTRRANGDIAVLENGTLRGDWTPPDMIAAAENWVELVVDVSALTAEVWVNGLPIIASVNLTGSYGTDPRHAVTIGGPFPDSYPSFSGEMVIGVMYVADERLGRCQAITQRPTDDFSVEFSRPQGDSNASQVEDVLGADGDASYVSSATAGDEDLYSSSDAVPLTNERIHAVAVSVSGRKEDIGSRSLVPIMSRSGTVAAGTPFSLITEDYRGGQSVFSVDPSASVTWTLAALGESKFGVRLGD